MLAAFITLTPSCRNKSIDCQKAKVRIAVLPIVDVKIWWNSTLELFEQAYWFPEFSWEGRKNSKYSDYRPLVTTQDQWTMIEYVKVALRPFWYWMLWMLKIHMVTLHHVITVYNDLFDHMDGIMQRFSKQKTQPMEDLYFVMKVAQQRLS